MLLGRAEAIELREVSRAGHAEPDGLDLALAVGALEDRAGGAQQVGPGSGGRSPLRTSITEMPGAVIESFEASTK